MWKFKQLFVQDRNGKGYCIVFQTVSKRFILFQDFPSSTLLNRAKFHFSSFTNFAILNMKYEFTVLLTVFTNTQFDFSDEVGLVYTIIPIYVDLWKNFIAIVVYH